LDSEKIALGTLIKPVGLKGEVRLQPEAGVVGLRQPKALYEQRAGRWFPWFLQRWELLEDGHWLLKLDGLDSPEEVKKLCGSVLWADSTEVLQEQEDDGRAELVGYQIQNQDGELIGPILEIVDNAGQWLAVVSWQEREVLIPLAEENILGVMRRKRLLQVDIPEGLLDL
jgi:16S rRNA processing protein RimM